MYRVAGALSHDRGLPRWIVVGRVFHYVLIRCGCSVKRSQALRGRNLARDSRADGAPMVLPRQSPRSTRSVEGSSFGWSVCVPPSFSQSPLDTGVHALKNPPHWIRAPSSRCPKRSRCYPCSKHLFEYVRNIPIVFEVPPAYVERLTTSCHTPPCGNAVTSPSSSILPTFQVRLVGERGFGG